jgi:hypothetical protein
VNLPHLAQRLFNTPLAIHPSKAEVIMAAVMDRFGISRIESSFAMEDDDYCYNDEQGRNTVAILAMAMSQWRLFRYVAPSCKNWEACAPGWHDRL